MPDQENSFIKGIVNMLIASLFFAAMGAAVKVVGQDYNSIQVVFWRNVFGTLIVLFSVITHPLKNAGGRPALLVFRGVIGTIALYALFYNLSHIEMGVAITFLQTSPIFVAIFSHVFLKEKLKTTAWLAIFIGFAGILTIFRPSTSVDWTTNLLGLANGVLAGAAYTALRGLRNHYESRTVVLSFTVSGLALPAISMLIGEMGSFSGYEYAVTQFKWPQGIQWLWLLAVAITALGGQLFLTRAYAKEKAGIISAIGYMTIPFAILIGIALGDPFPDLWSLMGICLIVISGILISVRGKGKFR